MRLRGRFTLWFVLAALLPIAAAALGTREVLVRTYREDFEKRTEQARASVERSLQRLEQRVSDQVIAMADPDSAFIGGLLQLLVNYEGELPTSQLKLQRTRAAPDALEQARFDLLVVTAEDGTVLLSPHYSWAQDDQQKHRVERARTTDGRPFFGLETVAQGGTRQTILAALATRDVSYRGHRVAVTGGVALGAEVLEGVRQPGSIDARIVDAEGEVKVAPAGGWPEADASRTFGVPLEGPEGQRIATVEVAVSAAGLEQLLEEVTLLSAVLAVAALILVILLGYLVSRGITRNLDELVTGAIAAARGDLDHEVPVESRDELGEVAHAFNAMMLDLKESKERLVMAERIAAWQEIARRLAHEIKNPLTPIQMAVETMRRTHEKQHPSFDEIFDESTRTVLEEAGRLKRIVSEFSEFARMPKPDKRPCDLNELVKSTLALYQGSVEVDKDLGELPELELDRDSISQVILNLLENARDAGGEHIRVQTRKTRGGKAVALMIDDDGPGIPQHVKDRLFTPYFTTKQAKGGTGLGLAIVHRIVSDHGGKISATEAPAGGARFIIELPAPGASEADLASSMSGHRGRS